MPLELSLPPLAQHLLLEVSDRFQEIFSFHIRGWDDNATVQELVDTIQEVLSVISKVGHLMEVLQQNISTKLYRCRSSYYILLNGVIVLQALLYCTKVKLTGFFLPCRTLEWKKIVQSHDSPHLSDWDQAGQT